MDTAINISGDLDTDENGRMIFVEGTDELKQRIYILLSAVEGEFFYDRALGSRIQSIDTGSANACGLIEAEARRVLGVLDGVEVTGAAVRDGEVFVFIKADGNEFEVEVRRSADE